MKLTRLTLILALGILSVPAAADDDAELAAVRAIVAEEFKELAPDDVSRSPIEGWYTVRKGAVVGYISADGRYLLQGDIIDLEEQVNLSDAARNDARIEMMEGIADDEAIVFTPDVVRHRVSVFTDIDCGYCRRLHRNIDDYLAEGIEIRYLLYPRGGPASESWVKAQRVWCADDRNEALTLAKQDKKFESRSCDSAMVSEHYALGQDVGLRGTPAIVFEDGTLWSGYLTPEQLSAQLDDGDAAE